MLKKRSYERSYERSYSPKRSYERSYERLGEGLGEKLGWGVRTWIKKAFLFVEHFPKGYTEMIG